MAAKGSTGLRRTSSFTLGRPTKNSVPARRTAKVMGNDEIVPDSEEENNKTRFTGNKLEIIELSDSDDDLVPLSSKKAPFVDDPFLSSPKKAERGTADSTEIIIQDSESDSETDVQPRYVPKSKSKALWSRRAVISDSEEEASDKEGGAKDIDNADKNDDDAILILNDPPPSRKPHPRSGTSPTKLKLNSFTAPIIESTPTGGKIVISDPSPLPTPVFPRTAVPVKQALLPDYFSPAAATPKKSRAGGKAKDTSEANPNTVAVAPPTSDANSTSPSKAPTTPANAKSPAKKRMTKKALEEQKQMQLAAYAQELFNDLNETVFKNRLSKETALLWNKKLQTTAGRAKWHINSQKVETTSIELSTKVLDCEERIRNTLSHEMCHLACWVINRNPKEGHGGTWNGWAYEVMEKRPDIKITTKHSYDIAYKFEWQCQGVNCKKVYGRHSKSIDPTKSTCGVCKVGELLPLFQTRPRKNKADSKLAAGRIRDSPSTFPSLWSAGDTETPLHLEQHSDASTSASNTDRELSGLDTDTDDCVFMIEPPELSQATIRASDLDKPTKSKVSGSDSNKNHTTGNIDRALDKLVTHISIIDLTED